jgi:hypothetical protein
MTASIHAFRDPRLLDFEELAIIADLSRVGAFYAHRRPARSLQMFELIEEVAAGNASMFPKLISDARQWLIDAGQELPSIELSRLTKPHLL